ncbi:XdhC family protein [Halobellus rubicundus]|uniref:XdhC family protein n=1 Tax=Halobellus rubicundus TaxID=2996466 RepID=A0ABD5M9W6_9EURY
MTGHETDGSGDGETPPADADATDGDVAALERTLEERGEPYARVTVVRREPPVSANVGDRAVVTADGDLHGWIGGAACAQTTATSEAQAALEAGEPRLVGIAPDPDDVDRPGLEAFPMHCHSEGVLELFVEPVNPRPTLLVVGDSPIARSVARLARELAVDVTVVDPEGGDHGDATTLATTDPAAIADAVGPAPLVVVASMGQFDARGVAAGVRTGAPYVGLVASEKRGEEVIERAAALSETDPESVADAVTSPAGIDVGARTPAEIAVSILAEVVEARSKAGLVGAGEVEVGGDADANADVDDDADADADDPPELATDPVCGMDADPETAPSVEHDGETYYFCCEGCAGSFRDDPESYLDGEETASA